MSLAKVMDYDDYENGVHSFDIHLTYLKIHEHHPLSTHRCTRCGYIDFAWYAENAR